MVDRVLIRGDGIAAACCAKLLTAGDVALSIAGTGGPRPASILLSESSQAVLIDIFNDHDLFRGLPKIRKRVVCWGKNSEQQTLPHSALVISEEVLVHRLWSKAQMPEQQNHSQSTWEIRSAEDPGLTRSLLKFGSQSASSSSVQLRPEADGETCWMESLEQGWLFLFTSEGQAAHLISAGGPTEELLSHSRLVASKVDSFSVSCRGLPACPRILSTLCAPGWLACGSAAMAFDPLCGEGAGNAVREAILASAVIHAVAKGLPVQALLAHYSIRLTQAFLRHLHQCSSFYVAAGPGHFWQSQLSLLQQGIAWAESQLAVAPAPSHRLQGFRLISI